ncbi:MAG TPA: hypothetical protein VER03_25550 [Bryobacteraceae bacterium]|nr:hypothetical protein [Bryobacteraceae bacterium]
MPTRTLAIILFSAVLFAQTEATPWPASSQPAVFTPKLPPKVSLTAGMLPEAAKSVDGPIALAASF